MDRKQTAVLVALEQSKEFLDRNSSVLQSVNATDTRKALDDVIGQLTSMSSAQGLHTRVLKGSRAKQVATKRVLLEHSMRGIVAVAKANLPASPELAGLVTAASGRVSNATLLTAATSMAQFATQHTGLFAGALGTGFLQTLQAATKDFQDAVAQGKATRAQRTAVTTGIDDQISRGRKVLQVLDHLVRPALAGNVQLLQEWQTRRKISGSSHTPDPPSSPPATATTQPAAAPPAASPAVSSTPATAPSPSTAPSAPAGGPTPTA